MAAGGATAAEGGVVAPPAEEGGKSDIFEVGEVVEEAAEEGQAKSERQIAAKPAAESSPAEMEDLDELD